MTRLTIISITHFSNIFDEHWQNPMINEHCISQMIDDYFWCCYSFNANELDLQEILYGLLSTKLPLTFLSKSNNYFPESLPHSTKFEMYHHEIKSISSRQYLSLEDDIHLTRKIFKSPGWLLSYKNEILGEPQYIFLMIKIIMTNPSGRDDFLFHSGTSRLT